MKGGYVTYNQQKNRWVGSILKDGKVNEYDDNDEAYALNDLNIWRVGNGTGSYDMYEPVWYSNYNERTPKNLLSVLDEIKNASEDDIKKNPKNPKLNKFTLSLEHLNNAISKRKIINNSYLEDNYNKYGKQLDSTLKHITYTENLIKFKDKIQERWLQLAKIQQKEEEQQQKKLKEYAPSIQQLQIESKAKKEKEETERKAAKERKNRKKAMKRNSIRNISPSSSIRSISPSSSVRSTSPTYITSKLVENKRLPVFREIINSEKAGYFNNKKNKIKKTKKNKKTKSRKNKKKSGRKTKKN